MYKIDHITLRKQTQGQGGVSQQDFDALKAKVQANEQHLNQNDGKLTTAEVNIANLQTKDTQLETSINNKLDTTTFNTEKTTLTNLINTKANDADVVKTTGEQNDIKGRKVFKGEIVFATNVKWGWGGNPCVWTSDSGTKKDINLVKLDILYTGDRDNGECLLTYNFDGVNGSKEIDLFKVHKAGKKASLFWRTNSPEWLNATGKWEWPSGSTFQCRGDAKSFRTPTANEDIANKQYVDALKTQMKDIARQSTDFNDFKTRMGNW